MKDTCLLIKTKEHKNFITYEKNLGSIIEFAKIFHAEIFLVKLLDKDKPMELKALTAAMCNSEYKLNPKHKKLDKIYPASRRPRKTILKSAVEIRKYIKKKLLAGKSVSLKELKWRYKNHDYTDACLCNHLSSTRKELAKDGHAFLKMGAGKYCLKNL